MSPRDLAFVGCRLLALYVLASSLQAIAINTWLLLQSFRNQQQWGLQEKLVEWGVYSVPMAALLILVVILWRRADWIADKATARITEAQSPASARWSPQIALSVAVVALGVWLLVDRVPVLVRFVYLLFGHDAEAADRFWVDIPFLVSTLFAIVLGLLCVFGAQTISGVVARIRHWSPAQE